MSDHQRRPALVIRPARSRGLLLFLLVVHLLAVVALMAVPLGAWPRAGLTLIVGLSLGYHVWASVLQKAPWSVREAILSEQGWRLHFQSGDSRSGTLLPSTLMTVSLVILNFRVGWWRRHSMLLTPEVVTPDLLRRVRARLRLEQGAF